MNGKELGRNKVLLEELDTLENEYPIFRANGGRIHIKPENRGKFTALKKRTGHSASWFKEHGTPAQKKMAVFALNARKWNHADGGPLGEENEIQVNHIPNWTVFGTDYSTWKPSDIQNIIDWGYTDPESFFGEEGESTRNALSRAGMADSVIGDIYANMNPELQFKFGDRYKGTKQRRQEYTGGITNAIDSAGQRIYQIADTVAGFVPGPVGMIDWLGHMGADAVEGEFGKVGKDLALAAGLGFGARALGKGVRYLKDCWDEIGNFGEDTFRAFTDKVPGGISTNFTYSAPATRAIVQAAVTAPYEIENLGSGYMLKSLMRGNPLEKQISKNGAVNVTNVRALVGKGSKVEQAVVDKVLASKEFAGRKSIDYNKFRKAVQDELITYERTPNTGWNNYGIDRLGISSYRDAAESPEMRNKFNKFIMNNFSWDPISDLYYIPGDPSSKSFGLNDLAKMFFEDGPGFLDTPVGVTKRLDTFTFSSPRIPNGSAKHYDPNTLGHSRTYTTADEPDVLHVMESQSDWAQSGNAGGRYTGAIKNAEDDVIEMQTKVREAEVQFEKDYGIKAPKFNPNYTAWPKGWSGQQWSDYNMIDNYRYDLKRRRENLLGLHDLDYEGLNQQYLADNYTSRQIQENLRYAAEKGQTKMRYPTRDTAAKIEGYSKSRSGVFELEPELRAKYDDFMASRQQKVNDIIRESAPEGYIDDYLQRWEEIPDEAIEVMDEAQKADLKRRSKLSWDFEKSEAGKKMKDDINRVYREYDERKWLDENVPATYLPAHETILRKYDAFPKQYKKLYKNADVRTVTDSKGNTWYEIDVPENYLQQEWAYKNGGKLQQYADFSGFF